MIGDDFIIDFENKRIFYSPKGSGMIYKVNELYSYIQDVFDEPENMRHEIPMEAKSKTEYFLVNDWTIDKEARKHLREGSLKSKLSNGEPVS